jgi:hypothetical protein
MTLRYAYALIATVLLAASRALATELNTSTEQSWARTVADDLRRRFPSANLVIENRAIGGFAAQLLVKTAESDLYPFYPDLVIFHVYGSHIEYENIIRRIRERTTAEILMQTDHLAASTGWRSRAGRMCRLPRSGCTGHPWPRNNSDWRTRREIL